AVTFTNQAAAEMRQRLEARLGGKRAAARMRIGTFHAICLDLLGDVKLLGQAEAMEIAAETLRDCGRKMRPRQLLQAVSKAKNGGPVEEPELYEAYCDRLQKLGVLDFDDLLIQAAELDTAGRKGFSHLLVDEFQDINDIQYSLVQNWSRGGKSLFVIGDPDQSIYGFRGASGQCFRRLAEDRNGIREIRLTVNYRSAPEVIGAALPVIGRNPGGPRRLEPKCPAGMPVRLVQAPDDFSEAVFIAKEIGRMTGGIDMLEARTSDRETRAFSEIAVLCRTHRQLGLIEKCLQHDDIPCVVSGREDFLDTDEVRGFLAFFRTLAEPRDTAALSAALRLLWNCPAGLIQKVQALCGKMAVFQPDVLKETVKGYTPLEAWLERSAEWLPLAGKEKPWKLAERWSGEYGGGEPLERLRNMAVFHKNFRELWDTLTLGEDADVRRAAGKRWESGAVRLMTLHASKGLEFPAVFVAGVNAGTLPLESQGKASDMEEERRLLFVGMTRAREELILSTAQPSVFLRDLPKSVLHERARQRGVIVQQFSLF
ncbi:MAG: ATP-dependent helicase, partial [Oscillospiraceae bacterium]|nr:ATP-dependent helicase [Oscillospiraceae bacterium]